MARARRGDGGRAELPHGAARGDAEMQGDAPGTEKRAP
jgi:hypothetical protein